MSKVVKNLNVDGVVYYYRNSQGITRFYKNECDCSLIFTLPVNIENPMYSKEEIKEAILNKISRINKEQEAKKNVLKRLNEIEKGEII